VYLIIIGGIGAAAGLWAARHDPDLLRERLGSPFQAGQPAWDKEAHIEYLKHCISRHLPQTYADHRIQATDYHVLTINGPVECLRSSRRGQVLTPLLVLGFWIQMEPPGRICSHPGLARVAT
jgi:hypothetical protein